MRRTMFAAALAGAMLASGAVVAKEAANPIAAALQTPGRPADAIALDAGRKPVEVLTFLGLKKGMAAADIMAGSGYYTEIMAAAVGKKGTVAAYDPTQFVDAKTKAAWDALKAREPNVSYATYPFDRFAAPAASADLVLLHLVYHDLYWSSEQYKVPRTDPVPFVKAVFDMTRPGGVVGVIDHVGNAGDTRAIVEKTHRIDPATVKADFIRAGFVLEGESPMLFTAQDDHNKLVFDPSVRGRTDRFVFKFRKPGGKAKR